jgi:hypothetical protein
VKGKLIGINREIFVRVLEDLGKSTGNTDHGTLQYFTVYNTVHCVFELLTVLGMEVKDDFDSFFQTMVYYLGQPKPLKFLKEIITNYWLKYSCGEVVDSKFKVCMGSAWKWLECRSRGGMKSGPLLVKWSVLNGLKKGLPHLNFNEMIEAFLTTAQELGSDGSYSQTIKGHEVDFLVDQELDKMKLPRITLNDLCGLLEADEVSVKACSEANCKEGGAYWFHFQDQLPYLCKKTVNGSLLYRARIPSYDLIAMEYNPYTQETRQLEGHQLFPLCPYSEFEAAGAYAKQFWTPLFEALKIRGVTKGPAWQRLGQLVRRRVWKFLVDKFPDIFRIDRPLCEEDIKKFIGQWVMSGDYSRATDKLKSWVTKMIVKKMSGDPWAEQYLTKCLCDTTIELGNGLLKKIKKACPERSGEVSEVVRQTDWSEAEVSKVCKQSNGQLMGNIHSFPILCIANYVCYKVSRIIARSKLPEALLINGDDNCFTSDPSLNDAWSKVATCMGFEVNKLKSYYSKEFVIMNSELYSLKTGKKAPYINMGFVMGASKSLLSADEEFVGSQNTQILSEGVDLRPQCVNSRFEESCLELRRFPKVFERMKYSFYSNNFKKLYPVPFHPFHPSCYHSDYRSVHSNQIGCLTYEEFDKKRKRFWENVGTLRSNVKRRLVRNDGMTLERLEQSSQKSDPFKLKGCSLKTTTVRCEETFDPSYVGDVKVVVSTWEQLQSKSGSSMIHSFGLSLNLKTAEELREISSWPSEDIPARRYGSVVFGEKFNISQYYKQLFEGKAEECVFNNPKIRTSPDPDGSITISNC